MKKIKISIILNLISAILVLLGTIFMLTGFKFMSQNDLLSVSNIEMFKFFTVDSNILLGISSIILMYYELRLIKGKIKEIPNYVFLLKMMATAGVVLTFLITLFYLVPTTKYPALTFYQNSNLFFHFIVPILAYISFTIFEKRENIPFKYTYYSLTPMFIYSIFYSSNIFLHLENGKISQKYDFYGFLRGANNLLYVFIVAIIIVLIEYSICYGLWKFNKLKVKEKNNK